MGEKETQLRPKILKSNKVKRLVELISMKKELVFILGLSLISSIIQIYFALNTWGMITSDEVTQSIEIAHRVVYGYGYICPEFKVINIEDPSFSRLRSAIYPLLFVIPIYLGKIFSLNYWGVTIPFIRIMIGLNGSLITSSTYCFIKRYTKGKKNYAALTAILVTFSPFIFLMSFRSVTQIALVPWIFFILASYLKIVDKFSNEAKEYLKIFILTILMGLIIYSRLDLILTLGVVLVFRFPYKKLKIILSHALGLIVAFLLGIFVDSLYYGVFTITPYSWFRFNVIDGKSEYFGISPFSFYFDLIFGLKPVFIIAILACSLFVILILRNIWQIIKKRELKLVSTLSLGIFLFASASIILVFSFMPHKEFRFVYSGYVYGHFSIAIALAILIEEVIPKLSKTSVSMIKKLQRNRDQSLRILKRVYTGIIFALIFSGALVATIKGTEVVDWKETNEISRGLAYVGQQNDSVGVIVVLRYMQGIMYSYLHKNISLEYFQDITKYNLVDKLTVFIKYRYTIYNYVILPTYQIDETPFLLDVLEDSNFVSVHNIDNSAYVFRHNSSS